MGVHRSTSWELPARHISCEYVQPTGAGKGAPTHLVFEGESRSRLLLLLGVHSRHGTWIHTLCENCYQLQALLQTIPT